MIHKWDDDDSLSSNVVSSANSFEPISNKVFSDTQAPLSYDMLLFPFYVFYIGCGVSGFVFVLEVLHRMFGRKNSLKDSGSHESVYITLPIPF